MREFPRVILFLFPLLALACSAQQPDSTTDTDSTDVPASDASRGALGVDRWSVKSDASSATIDGFDGESQAVYHFEAHETKAADGTHAAIRFGDPARSVIVDVLKSTETGAVLGAGWSTSDGKPIDTDAIHHHLQALQNDLKNAPSTGTGGNTSTRAAAVRGSLHAEDLIDQVACSQTPIRWTSEADGAILCALPGLFNGSERFQSCQHNFDACTIVNSP